MKLKSKLKDDEVIGKMTMIDVIQYYFEGISIESANDLLWNRTCYPFHHRTALSQIYNIYKTTFNNLIKQ